MKCNVVHICKVFWLLLYFSSCSQQDEFSGLKGPYLGQNPPGMTPELFAPGIISTGYEDFKVVFSPDGKELYFQLWGAPYPVILETRELNGQWTAPKVASFSGQLIDGYGLSPDGKKMFISSRKPLKGKDWPSETDYIRILEKSENGWDDFFTIRPSIIGYPTVAESGDLYLGSSDLYISEYVDGHYKDMVKLDGEINSEKYPDTDPFVAPDESYMLFCRRDDGLGSWDIFVSFRKNDGTWTKAQNMGEPINSSVSDVYPFVTSDGKYLFFSSRRTIHKNYSETPLTYDEKINILNSPGNGSQDIYWVDARIIDEFKPKQR